MRSARGFTLLEVTLASVVGIVLVSGATLLYAQAQSQAGNTRAKAKVLGAQGVIESMAARQGGAYPTVQAAYNSLSLERTDIAQSPWGGQAGNGGGNGNFNVNGFGGTDNDPGNNTYGVDPTFTGQLRYNTLGTRTDKTVWDVSLNQTLNVVGYDLAIGGPRGDKRYFVQTAR